VAFLETRASRRQERMDDFDQAEGAALAGAFDGLDWANRWLGGYASVQAALRPLVKRRRGMIRKGPAHRGRSGSLHLLDVGAGGGDLAARLVRWADGQGAPMEVTALDANPHAVRHARAALDRRLPAYLRARVRVEEGDALALPFASDQFDAATALLVMHHFDAPAATDLLREMDRVSARGLVVSDLHRHAAAYLGVKALAKMRPGASAMFAHDAPLSVRRGYRRPELRALADRAGLPDAQIRWRWAFRWVVSTVAGRTLQV
jgi:SAM-dependent methyltransferase